jgi:hydroxyethylthiazole kinase-like uncharacterized protein yjeF
MKVVSVAQMRELDRRTIEDYNTPPEELMDRAGAGVASIVEHLVDMVSFSAPRMHLIAGRGNNGGDAFAAARYLHDSGYDVLVWLAGSANDLKGESLQHLSRLRAEGVEIEELPTKEHWEDAVQDGPQGEILVDGVLGVGVSGPARGPAVGAIQYINACAHHALVVSIDVPSGLDADSGVAHGEAVKADVTAAIGLPKTGLIEPAALEYVGAVDVVDIGIPSELVSQVAARESCELIHFQDLIPLFPRRWRSSHKGDYGRVLIIGGAAGYAGAPAMAARAAIRSGAGLVTVVTPQSVASVVAGACLECMVHAAPEMADGTLAPEIWNEWSRQIARFDAVLVGPGLGRGENIRTLVRNIVRECSVPLVLDADALTVLAGQAHWLDKARGPVVITPHPGEFATLMGQRVEDIQQDRPSVALAAARFTRATVVLKGAGTVIAQTDKPVAINLTGNPGMATGGAGDVLAGMLVALLAQGLAPYDAARAAVYLHGQAGDFMAWRKSQIGLIAGDIIEEIPYVFRTVSVR